MVEEIYLARPRGFCAGVVRAIAAVEETASGQSDPVILYHSVVHNRTVMQRLEERFAIYTTENLAEIGDKSGSTLIFSAHGVAPSVRQQALASGFQVVDATCPLVTKVHSEAARYASLGYHILLLSDSADHQEIRGTFGVAPDSTTLVGLLNRAEDRRLADPRTVDVPDPNRVAVLSQTTLSVDETLETVALLRNRFPKLVTPARADLCYATQNRQAAVRQIAPQVELFIVVSGPNSSNGNRLVELAQTLGTPVHRIESAADLEVSWFQGVRRVGITSAASTPEDLVQEVVTWLRQRNPELKVQEQGQPEKVEFKPARKETLEVP